MSSVGGFYRASDAMLCDRHTDTHTHRQTHDDGVYRASSNCDDLACMSRSSSIASFSMLTSASRGPSAIAELLVCIRKRQLESVIAETTVSTFAQR